MKGLNPEMMNKLQQGAFVRHIPGIYNSTWTDMFIETTYMRLGHGPAGTTGMATDYHHGEVGPQLCPHWRSITAMSNNE